MKSAPPGGPGLGERAWHYALAAILAAVLSWIALNFFDQAGSTFP
jgi:hypothetical protein